MMASKFGNGVLNLCLICEGMRELVFMVAEEYSICAHLGNVFPGSQGRIAIRKSQLMTLCDMSWVHAVSDTICKNID